MNVWVTVKSLGKRKPALAKQATALPETTGTLRELIKHMVHVQVNALQEKKNSAALLTYLMPEEIQLKGSTGKVGFGEVYNEEIQDLEHAVQTAMMAYEDGLYKVFLNDEELSELDAPLKLQEDDELVFIRFTMLAGRLW
ncbi:hypothetical protein ABEW19_16940 [Paenibacillus illinoisensis]|uniref:hypothetical protein n=1 Tax=Paenibacillus illinoisensis TaxID=59845 RepID=UPI0012BA1BB9|nr:hypothetical protein [Paenibacillus xylanexedens]